MAPVVAQFARLVVFSALVLAPFAPVAQPTAAAPSTGETPTCGIKPEVRLRKLHLVRPDLIPYPIAYEVCC
ncbi:MAG TPA: hypothetical protein VER17_01250 [Tepidisphaeraceae bacterium]|nr:hypothetical protein [Tepidisphaeraceae bacterium]